jgi:hypothetical protein
MTAFNVVRFRVKPGTEEEFVEAHRRMRPNLKGLLSGSLIKTGDQTYCLIGEWRNFQSIVNARPLMISMLDEVRAMLEDLGSSLGVTDPVSGQTVAKLALPKAAKKRPAKAGGKTKRAAGKRAKGKPAGKRSPAKRKR